MADPISVSSGIITLALFAFNCSVSLYDTVKSLQDPPKVIRDLQRELDEFSRATDSLRSIAVKDEENFHALRLCLLDCGEACKDFEQLVTALSRHSTETRINIVDWAKLRLKTQEILRLKDKLAMYRDTINIATSASILRTTVASAKDIEYFKEQLNLNTVDLKGYLEDLETRLKTTIDESNASRVEDPTERDKISQALKCAKDCLNMCDRTSKQLDSMRTHEYEDTTVDTSGRQFIVSTTGELIKTKRVTTAANAYQVLGNMSDATLQCIFNQLPEGQDPTISTLPVARASDSFTNRFGGGHKI